MKENRGSMAGVIISFWNTWKNQDGTNPNIAKILQEAPVWSKMIFTNVFAKCTVILLLRPGTLVDNLQTIFGQIRATVPGVTIFMTGYAQMAGPAECQNNYELISVLNGEIQTACQAANVNYYDHTTFFCGTTSSWSDRSVPFQWNFWHYVPTVT